MTEIDSYFQRWTTAPNPEVKEEKAPESDPSIPDGEHRCRVIDFQCFQSKQGDVWMKWTLAVLGGIYDGRTLVRMVAPLGRRTDDEQKAARKAQMAKGDLQTVLGYIPNFWEEVFNPQTGSTGPIVSKIVGAIVMAKKEVNVSSDGREFLNVYLNALVAAAPEAAAASSGGPPPSAPFPDDSAPPSADFGMSDPEEEVPF